MKKSWLIAAVVAGLLAGCSDDKDKSSDDDCPANAAYNSAKGQCECNTGYVMSGNVCVDTKACDAPNAICPSTGACVADIHDTSLCPTDMCASVVCKNGKSCNENTGICECVSPKVECSDGKCVDDASVCTCEPKTCDQGEVFNEQKCACEPASSPEACGVCNVDTDPGYGSCKEASDCKSDMYDTCYNGKCVHKDCIGKTWSCGTEYCSITGSIVQYVNACCSDNQCDVESGESCNLSTNECKQKCAEPDNNIILNWSFEDWYNGMPSQWSLYDNAYSQAAIVKESNAANTCEKAVQLINPSEKQARLEGDLTSIADDYGETFISSGSMGYNYHLDCTMYVKGSGHINFGYRAYDENGKEVVSETYASQKGIDVNYNSYSKIEFSGKNSLSIVRNATKDGKTYRVSQFMPLIAFHGTEDSGLIVDSLSCVPSKTVCSGVTCAEDWQICDINLAKPGTNEYGYCGPKEGFCDIFKWTVTTKNGEEDREKDTCGGSIATCNTTTHKCVQKDGGCLTHSDCQSDNAPYCDASTHTCKAGDPCENAKCSDWMECTTASRGTCVLKDGYCRNSTDCLKNKPLCNPNTHQCVEMDATNPVTSDKSCGLGWYYDYLNCDQFNKSGSKCEKWNDDLVCPVNIVPNGDFETWDECDEADTCLTVDGKAYPTPYFWFGNYYGPEDGDFDGIAEYHYTNELPVNMTAPYTKAPHTGNAAMQILYPYNYKVKAPKRFVSMGFNVPGGTYDCSYWVRGKGEVRFHWYGSRGDAAKDMTPNKGEYKSYDTTEWTRETFTMKNSQSGVRLIFYVGDTDASKDHIQIDDVACTKRTYANAE